MSHFRTHPIDYEHPIFGKLEYVKDNIYKSPTLHKYYEVDISGSATKLKEIEPPEI